MEQRVLRWRKNLIVLPYRWYDGMDVETIEIFGNRRLESTDQRNCDQLRHWKSTDVNRKWLFDFPNLAANYLQINY